MVLEAELELGRENLQMPGIDIEQRFAPKLREERRMDRARDVPQQVRAAHNVEHGVRGTSIDLGAF